MTTLEEVIKRKRELRKKRRVIFNDDGALTAYYEASDGVPISEDTILNKRPRPFSGQGTPEGISAGPSDITTYVLNTGFSGYVLHDSQIPLMQIGSPHSQSVYPNLPGDASQALIDITGKDALKIVSDFYSSEATECFYGVRVNDRHDGGFSKNELPPLKQAMWDEGGLMKNGVVNGLNFEHPAARQIMTDTILEVFENHDYYKVNGLFLDFYRHFGVFKNAADPKLPPTSQTQTDIVTDWLYYISDEMDQISRTLMDEGREPLLLIIKIADHPLYNKLFGYDVEKWMKDGKIDGVVTMGYHQFRHIRDSVVWGDRFGVPVYPSLLDTRVTSPKQRTSITGFKARTMQIFGASPYGFEIFNYNYNSDPHFRGPSGSFWRHLKSYDNIVEWNGKNGVRRYYQTFANDFGADPGGGQGIIPSAGIFSQYVSWVSANHNWSGTSGKFDIEIYEKPENVTSVVINLYIDKGSVDEVLFNGEIISFDIDQGVVTGSIPKDYLTWGINFIEISGDNIILSDIEVVIE